MKVIRYFPYGDSNDIAKVEVRPNAQCEHDWCEKVGKFTPAKARWPFVCCKCGKSAGCDEFGGVRDKGSAFSIQGWKKIDYKGA